MAKLHWPGGALTAPVPPALVTCGSLDGGDANVLTIAWTGIINTVPPKTYVSVRPKRHSYPIIKAHGEFVVNLPTAALIRAVDSCGVYTGAKMNKISAYSLTPEKATKLSCPTLAQSPVSLECRVVEVKDLGSHDMFLAEIVAVDVEESLIDDKGKLDLKKANLLAYSHGDYIQLGKKIGSFGFAVKKKSKGKGKA